MGSVSGTGLATSTGHIMSTIRSILAGLFALALAAFAADAAVAATVTIKVGYGAGGTYDISSRLVAQFLGKYLPGNPEVIVQNVPGGGSLKLTKLLLSGEPADGSVIGSISPGMATAPALDPENADFDASKIIWIGSLSSEPAFCVTTKASGIDTMEKFLSQPFLIGASAKNSTTYTQAAIPKNGLGAKYEIVTGFDGVPEIVLAMERGELAGYCSATARDIERGTQGDLNVIGRLGTAPSPELPEVPRFSDAITDPTVKTAAQFIESARDVNYPLMVPPGTPDDIVATLRSAYDKVVVDPEFVAAVKASGELELDPKTGAEMTDILAEHLNADAAVIAAAKALIN